MASNSRKKVIVRIMPVPNLPGPVLVSLGVALSEWLKNKKK
jgi:hypothetical protein